MKEVLSKFGRRIRELRKQQGLTQEKLAERAGLHHTYVGAIERGEQNVSLKNIAKIAQALGVEVGEFFPFTPKDVKDKIDTIKDEVLEVFLRHSKDPE